MANLTNETLLAANESILAPIPDITMPSAAIPTSYILIAAALAALIIIAVILFLVLKKKKVESPESKLFQEEKIPSPPPQVSQSAVPVELKQAVGYIKETRLGGFSDTQIKDALRKNSWADDKIENAFKYA